jgi:hypothetical protein
MKRAYLLPLLLVLPLGCHDDPASGGYSSRRVLPMVALDDSVAYVDGTSGLVFLLDPADPALRPRLVPTGKSPIAAEKRKGANQLLVLSHGDQGSASTESEPARLFLIDPASKAPPVTTDLPGRYGQLAQSDDGVFAILYYDGSVSSGVGGSMLYNPNDLAVVRLDGSKPLASRPIRSLGSVPIGVRFSPPGSTLFGQRRNLAVVLAQNYVTLLDLDNADRTEITVPLVPDGKRTVTPAQVLFDMAGPAIYIRADGSNDVFQISLAQGAPAEPNASNTSNDFHVSLSLIGSGSAPSDMAMFGTGDKKRLAVTAPGNRQIAILDPTTGSATSIPTGVQVNRILLFNGPSPKSSENQDRALLAAVGTGESSLVFADLKDIETAQGLALESWSVPAPVVDITSLPGNIALLTHQYAAGGAALSIVNLFDRTIEPIGSSAALDRVTVEATVQSRLWGTDGANRVEYLDLVDRGQGRLYSGEVVVDRTITNIVPLAAKSADGKRHLVLEMEDPTNVGYVTVLYADQPDRKAARSAYGFLLTDYLERGQP